MKYNRSEIMKDAHSVRRQFKCSISTALKMAWVAAKKKAIIDRYDSESFIARMHDSYSAAEYTTYNADPEFIALSCRDCDLWERATMEGMAA